MEEEGEQEHLTARLRGGAGGGGGGAQGEEGRRHVVFECRASSVLQRNVSEYGVRRMFDAREETCWNSDQGSPQSLTLRFFCLREGEGEGEGQEVAVRVLRVRIMFQGGFVGQECQLQAISGGEDVVVAELEPEDTNELQEFDVLDESESCSAEEDIPASASWRLVFGGSTDFYGRVTIYRLEFHGAVVVDG